MMVILPQNDLGLGKPRSYHGRLTYDNLCHSRVVYISSWLNLVKWLVNRGDVD